ncbi:coiled-coil domain-containing protein [uncultured Desulfovibrio sp.]|uniref:coiled-coil domain-containing protein n=1 Tax=uncultured Desulfovibrio sp. TaxID=167968 RepID=UPI0026373520|nr:coiled-coil domain-containing protein [uncultured Desulfovibrio sp.]
MTTTTFDSLGYVRKLEEAGFTRQQAEAQAEAMREQLEAQRAALQRELDKYDEASRRELATKGDVQDVRLEIEKVRAEVEKVKYDLLKWQIGGWLALAAIMAKGFGWLGF